MFPCVALLLYSCQPLSKRTHSASAMEVIKCFEDFGGPGDPFAFHHSVIAYSQNDAVYQACSKSRYKENANIKLSDLYNIILIPIGNLSAPFDQSYTKALNPSQWYIKRPQVWSYDANFPNFIPQQILREVEVCEIIRKHPHPNIAQYHGCEVQDGWINGLCFTKYDCNLHQKVNPHKNSKWEFVSRRGDISPADISIWLKGIEAGIQHLHSLGLVHNDINPANIMFQGNVPVIIDFDICSAQGAGLSEMQGSTEWYNENRTITVPKNDLDALQEIDTWLRGSVDDFIF